MIDPFGLIALVRDLVKDWTEEKIILISPLADIENEPTYQQLKAQGSEFHWCSADKVRRRTRNGWEPVIYRDKLKRPSVFMDGRKELLLMHRPKNG